MNKHAELLPPISEARTKPSGWLDWLIDPAEAVKIRGNRPIVFQGNADPGVLYGSDESISQTVQEMVQGFGGGKKGWIGNLGHGKPHEKPTLLVLLHQLIARL